MWDLIVSVPDHCLSFYLLESTQKVCHNVLKQLLIVTVKLLMHFNVVLQSINGVSLTAFRNCII